MISIFTVIFCRTFLLFVQAITMTTVFFIGEFTETVRDGGYQGGKRPGGETGSQLLVQCLMQRRTGTSAPFSTSGEINGCQKFPLNKPEINFSFFIFEPRVV